MTSPGSSHPEMHDDDSDDAYSYQSEYEGSCDSGMSYANPDDDDFHPDLAESDYPDGIRPPFIGDSPIVDLGPEEILESLENELRELREILAAPQFHIPDPTDDHYWSLRTYSLHFSSIASSELSYTMRRQKKALEDQGRTLKTMTIDDWRKYELPMALLFVMEFKFTWIHPDRLKCHVEAMEMKSKEQKDDDEVVRSSKNEQVKQFLYELIEKSHKCCLYNMWIREMQIFSLGLYSHLDSASSVCTLVLAMELLVKSSVVCDSIQGMKQWVKEKIAGMDTPLSPPSTPSQGHEEMYERVEKELSNLKEILVSPASHVPDDSDVYNGSMDFSGFMSDAVLFELTHTVGLQEEALEQQGLTLESLTMDDWRAHELPMALMLVMENKHFFLNPFVLKCILKDMERRRVELNGDEVFFSSKSKQVKKLLCQLIDESHNLHLYDIWIAEKEIYGGASYSLVDKLLSVYDLLLLTELIIKSSRICDSIQDMKRLVKDQIIEVDTALTPVLGLMFERHVIADPGDV